MTTFSSFKIMKKLTIHRIHVNTKNIRATYTVENRAGGSNSFELYYSYNSPYLNKTEPADVNLACIILSQAALNYGLFFDVIEFDGLFDQTDQQFIREFMENTSREILTNKLLVENEFLIPRYSGLNIEKKIPYTQSRLFFSNTLYQDMILRRENIETDPNKYAILSSGGKDSLLTYGIIKEIGEPFPVFINEAGRHWFTAVNAYRYLKQTEPNTLKPWCNCDRLFNWMLKQLPFIKRNYASIRSDMYPIRLWTVGVFLFGVLPIVRKHKIGNILIGDEYDTTIKSKTRGIPHFNGLYDQSKYFDNAMTRYYRKKGWMVSQYSILRSVSELLIMKILIKRYPELQKHQVSCHAAHAANSRMHPCGKCEKCRRIIGMIKALGENPELCGFTESQIKQGLESLEKQSVKQISSDASHLYHMLLQNNLIRLNPFTKNTAKFHPEITKLRFDRERSNLEDLPRHIRESLFEILLKYSDGAVKKERNRWVDVMVDKKFLDQIQYKFDEE